MKPPISTSIEQSHRLLSCGVDPKSTDWVRRTARRLGLKHSEPYRRDDNAYRAKKIPKTRKEKFAE